MHAVCMHVHMHNMHRYGHIKFKNRMCMFLYTLMCVKGLTDKPPDRRSNWGLVVSRFRDRVTLIGLVFLGKNTGDCIFKG